MSQFRPLFVTSTARSGSYLISMMLSTNKDITVASEPYLGLFRSLRNALVRRDAPSELQESFDPSSPIQDYYFTDERIKLMDVVQAGDLNDTLFDPQEWDQFLEVSALRTGLQCAELVPYLSELRGSNYKDVFDNALKIIAKARNAEGRKWVGIKDAWTIEYFTLLARAYPDARFIVILRDPRAIINSNLGITKTSPSEVVQPMSYGRHWRKIVAFALKYRGDSTFAGRLHLVTHERVLEDPEKAAREMCEFLDVEYDPAMLDTDNYYEYATGSTWIGNSTFETVTSGISMHRADRWRKMLDPKVSKMVDFMCGPDMNVVGYEPLADDSGQWPEADILEHIIECNEAYTNWRSDLGDPQQDYGFELFRRAMLALPERPRDTNLIRRSFLFEEAFDRLRRVETESRAAV
jgi:hypothetical protein